MKSGYLIAGTYRLPSPFFWLLVSWTVSLSAFTLFGIGVWAVVGEPQHDLLESFPQVFRVLLGIWGIYTGIGAMVLWILMWAYWAAQKHKTSDRVFWFFALLFGMYYGALIYAISIWRNGLIKRANANPN